MAGSVPRPPKPAKAHPHPTIRRNAVSAAAAADQLDGDGVEEDEVEDLDDDKGAVNSGKTPRQPRGAVGATVVGARAAAAAADHAACIENKAQELAEMQEPMMRERQESCHMEVPNAHMLTSSGAIEEAKIFLYRLERNR